VVEEDENDVTGDVNAQLQVDPIQIKNVIDNSTDFNTILAAVQNCRKVKPAYKFRSNIQPIITLIQFIFCIYHIIIVKL